MSEITTQPISKSTIEECFGKEIPFEQVKEIIFSDYKLACESREVSIQSRREVLTGKAKFGILGDGKELPQIALSKVFNYGDFRSGYYRDQTIMMATGNLTIKQAFAQLYANPNLEEEPHSGGRQMNAHFATRSLNSEGVFKNLMKIKNTSADISCTAGQMARSVGLAFASKCFRHLPDIQHLEQFSNNGNEVVFATIGDASTSEGVFWETINAAGVLQIPLVVSIWDDGYGISVPIKYQTTKGSISKVLKGFEKQGSENGFDIYSLYAWDYPSLCKAYRDGIARVRETHIPAVFHIKEVTQPLGHSTSGSHERYKSEERLQWEKDFDCLSKFKTWILHNEIASEEELKSIETDAKKRVREIRIAAWKEFNAPIQNDLTDLLGIFDEVGKKVKAKDIVKKLNSELISTLNPLRSDLAASARKMLILLKNESPELVSKLRAWTNNYQSVNQTIYSSHLTSQSRYSPLKIQPTPAVYSESSPKKNGYEILNACFDALFARDPRVFAFGEDVGDIGDVNQGMAGMQEKYGLRRIFDTGIRELTIIGQGLGMAMRGLRPITEIQYLDYFMYGMQTVVDDLACLHYRTRGGQKAPLIIRTRGHRLEGIWHSGSPMAMILNGVRGVHLLVPRNMTQAAGFYNTLMLSDDPAIVVEVLNGYRLKERMPDNIGSFTLPLGVPETIRTGTDISIVTYGACCKIALEAAETLATIGIDCEIIDVQSLLPFDIDHKIVDSLKKTNRIIFLDEDVPGGASAYMMQQVLEIQKGYQYLDTAPLSITAKAHRPAYGSDGDYYSKPNQEDIMEAVYAIMHEDNPNEYPLT